MATHHFLAALYGFWHSLKKQSSSQNPLLKYLLLALLILVQNSAQSSALLGEEEEEARAPQHIVPPLQQGKDKLWILSIDGGGIRGLIPAYLLQYVEERAEHAIKERIRHQITQDFGGSFDISLPSCPVYFSHCFDIMAGTSTGGIISLGLNIPQESQSSSSTAFQEETSHLRPLPKYKASDLVQLYQEKGHIIFSKPSSTVRNLFSKKYNAAPVESVFKEYFGEVSLSDLITTTLVTAYEMRQENLIVLDSRKAKHFKSDNFHARDAARSTSAAPTYFSAAQVKNFNQEPYLFADGGLIANNPAQIAYMRGQALYPKAKRIMMLSLGTGEAFEDTLSELKDAGLLEWAPHVASVMMKGVSDLGHALLKQNAETLGQDIFDYTRIQITLNKKRAVMDDVTSDNLDYLLQIAKREAESSHPLKRFIKLLAEDLAERHIFFPALQQDILLQLSKGPQLSLRGDREFKVLSDLHMWEMGKVLKTHAPLSIFEVNKLTFSSHALRYLLSHMPSLQEGSFHQAGLDASKLLIIIKALPQLTSLSLEANPTLGREGIALLTQENLPSLKHLNVTYTNLSDEEATLLAQNLPQLESLSIGKNPLTPQGVKSLLRGLTILKALDLTHSDGTFEVIQALKTGVSLTSLNLAHNKIDDKTLESLVAALRDKPIASLNLRVNEITEKSSSLLRTWLEHHPSLTWLNLENNGLGHEGAKSIIKALETNTSLKNVNLSRNLIGVEGIQDLPTMLRMNSTLEGLILTHNEESLSTEGLDILKQSGRVRRVFKLEY